MLRDGAGSSLSLQVGERGRDLMCQVGGAHCDQPVSWEQEAVGQGSFPSVMLPEKLGRFLH